MALPLVASIGVFLWNNHQKKENNELKPSAPPPETNCSYYISGYIKDSYFYHGENILKLNKYIIIRVTNIFVYPRTELRSTLQKYL